MTNKQDKREFGMAMAALFEAYATKPEDAGPVRIRVYEEGLKDIPVTILNAAVRKAISTRQFFPKVAELRADAEACRKELIAAHTFMACAQCDETGWDTTLIDGVSRVSRCMCWKAHQQKLSELGVTAKPLALPAAREMTAVGDIE